MIIIIIIIIITDRFCSGGGQRRRKRDTFLLHVPSRYVFLIALPVQVLWFHLSAVLSHRMIYGIDRLRKRCIKGVVKIAKRL